MTQKIRPTVTVLFLAVLTLLVLGLVPSAVAGGGKMNVCHRTGSKSNPYVGIQPSSNAKGHSTHPDKNGNTDHFNDPGWRKGPHQSSDACTSSNEPVVPPPPPPCPKNSAKCPPPPNCPTGSTDCPEPTPVVPPAPPGSSSAIPGTPTVTG